ncbi:MAG: reverse transcriptase domain-containing protein [Ignavibacteriales bacterium]
MSGNILKDILNKSLWEETIHEFEIKNFNKKDKALKFKEIVDSGEYLNVAKAVLASQYRFSLPTQYKINKKDTSKKKTIYIFPLKDELLLKVVNKILNANLSDSISELCHSFQKKKSSKTAFKALMIDRELIGKHCFKLDIQDYFNSININSFLSTLPPEIKNDKPLFNLLEQLLLDQNVIIDNVATSSAKKGVMAGTPLAPYLSNIFLKPLDDYFKDKGITYARYSDDIIFFSPEKDVHVNKEYIEKYLVENELTINNNKTKLAKPGEAWEYLGFKYDNGIIDLSDMTIKKLKYKVTRITRYLNRSRMKYQFNGEKTVRILIKYLNRKLYGKRGRSKNFCWAQWFFPLLNSSESLKQLDAFIQEKLRYAATGRYSKKNYKIMPYNKLRELGYIPLTTAFFAYRNNANQYFELIKKVT